MSERKALETEPYKGVRDFYPEDWARMTAIFTKVRTVLGRWGYEEYQASPLERSEIYESKGNEEIINEQTYTFEDRGGRRVTLRPEMTPTLARMVAGKRRELSFPLRWFSIGNRFRYERPQKGRLREFYQTDIDFVGLPAGESDIEILTIASEILKAFGATEQDFSIRVNSRALLSAACRATGYTDEEGAREYWRLLDRKSKMSAEEFEKARGDRKDPLSAIEDASDADVAREKETLMTLLSTLSARGIKNAVFDPEIVRGFDYYTGIVFEIIDTNPENPRSLFGGGRYDGLVTMFGGEPIPAVGFAFGDVTFADFLTTHDLLPKNQNAPVLFIGTPSKEDVEVAQNFAQELRSAGVSVFLNLTEKNLGDQIKEAVKRSIPYFIAFGKNEGDSGEVKIKTLATGAEEVLSRESVAAYLTKDL
ncbi:MAG: histidine--tRNA ligase [Minisyncoccia bacterium]